MVGPPLGIRGNGDWERGIFIVPCERRSWSLLQKFSSQALKKQEFVGVGVDLGINHLATLSTGKIFDGVKSYKKYESKLARMQYLNRHKQVGSNNYKKATIKIARLHQKIANTRKDSLHKITTYLSKKHAVIGIEDLNRPIRNINTA
ncbi:transposase [Nostoc sp. ChiQUE01b]|uniref:RNA-guided endonuclease InsQ/TnpB family protein n=1 Tax=Nostoc sp. ChiQUE01b TaxID=3075376 RepID=UPI002AD3E501|nr:transposase [Nostoc sp. ChiQUE01b]MDZ8261708.1 transposase [Nostoc sp. ChiQUE01b]